MTRRSLPFSLFHHRIKYLLRVYIFIYDAYEMLALKKKRATARAITTVCMCVTYVRTCIYSEILFEQRILFLYIDDLNVYFFSASLVLLLETN